MNASRFAIAALSAAVLLTYLPAAAAAPAAAGPAATVNRAVAAFNKGDMKTWAAQCASPAVIVDDFAPYTWAGETACADWWSAYVADAKKNGHTDGMVTLGAAWHADVTGSSAYVVTPATYTYKQGGKAMSLGGVFTFALKKGASGWLITGWSWADH